jgi:23S rRNA pseudouridine2605 synthase
MPIVRLQKALAHAGVASRRAAEALIAAGRVRVDGQVVTELGTRVDPRKSRVDVDGRRVIAESHVYVVLHKPRSVVSTMSDPEGRPTVRELLKDVPGRVYPVGRLDFATSGVLFATNDGDFAEGLMHPRRNVPKTYVLKVQGEMQPKDLDLWRHGIELEDGKTLPAKVKLLRHEAKKTWMELTITEGRNQQVRRMGDASGFRVMRLARTAFAGISSEGLRPGQWRYLTADELTTLKADFGVPKRAVSPPRAPPPREPPKRVPSSVREPSRRESSKRGPSAGRDPSKRVTPGRGDPSKARPSRVERGPRYGGGAPGRRDADVREHWGGGIRRGSSGARDDERGGPSAEGQGRGGRTRTTGTGGGIGAEPGANYRVRGRRP